MTIGTSLRRRVVIVFSILALLAAACSEPDDDDATTETTDTSDVSDDTATDTSDDDMTDDDASDPTTTDTETSDTETTDAPAGDSIVEEFAGEDWFLGTVPDTPVEADFSLEPIRIGMINQEDTPAGSFPELRFAADAAINWINAELGGVGGRPIELFPCVSEFSVESSQACAQELVLDEVVALVGGIDVLMQGALPVLQQNGIPIVGGIPAGLAEQQSEIAFAFSGGGAAGLAAFMAHAAEQGYERAFLAYGEFDSFQVAAEDYAAVVGEDLGLDVRLRAFPIFGADFTSVLNDAKTFDADAVIISAADSACVPVMESFRELGFEGTLYLVGACAAEEIIDAAIASDNAQAGVVFSSEGPPDRDNVEGNIFDRVSTTYNNGDAQAAGTVGFRGMMNLYGILDQLGPDGITSQAIIEALQASVDRDSFWGHPYTCDGNQVPGLPSLCAPQQTLFNMDAGNDITFISDWIDTVALFDSALN